MSITEEQIDKYWGDWLLWRMAGRRVEAFVLAQTLPRSMLNTIFELDSFYGTMEAKHLKEKAKREKRNNG